MVLALPPTREALRLPATSSAVSGLPSLLSKNSLSLSALGPHKLCVAALAQLVWVVEFDVADGNESLAVKAHLRDSQLQDIDLCN